VPQSAVSPDSEVGKVQKVLTPAMAPSLNARYEKAAGDCAKENTLMPMLQKRAAVPGESPVPSRRDDTTMSSKDSRVRIDSNAPGAHVPDARAQERVQFSVE
jgi:hypothetical protein